MGFWATAEEAIRVWARDSMGLSDRQVYWANQRIPERVRPFVRLKRISHVDVGGVGGEIRYSNTPKTPCGDPPPFGEEVTVTAVGRRAFTVSVQVFASAVVGDEQKTVTSDAEKTAVDYMREAELSLILPSVIEKFDAAGIVQIKKSAITDLPADAKGTWISRAHMDVQFNYTFSKSERIPSIDVVVIDPELA